MSRALVFSPSSSNNKHQKRQVLEIPKGARWEMGFVKPFFKGLVLCTGHTLDDRAQGIQDEFFPFENLGHK